MKNKANRQDLQDMERLLRELELHRSGDDRSDDDSQYLNPWNLDKKKIRGKTFVSAKLPNKLPTDK
jgi:hypothetical protein